jgi:hypothetical protein
MDFVTFEIAKKLKDLGFDKPCSELIVKTQMNIIENI